MLGQRIITAAVLLALFLPALFADSSYPFAWLTLAFVAAGGWEWARLNGHPGWPAWLCGGLVAALCAWGWSEDIAWRLPVQFWQGMAIGWLILGSVMLAGNARLWRSVPSLIRLLLGVIILCAAWIALWIAKSIGINFLLSLLALVWAADIGAYFGGRALGHHKLAPSISPGKSWEGVYSGVASVLVLACAWFMFDRWLQAATPGSSSSLYSLLLQRWSWPGLLICTLVLTGMSIVGDLFESLVKRSAGMKDSSNLLPGHGGVLDRLDALLPVLPIAMALLVS